MKRIWRHKALRVALIVLPIAFALVRAIFARNLVALRAAESCPIICALLLSAVLWTQWLMDDATGLMAGLRSCPTSRRAITASRVVSGAMILAAQMAVFAAILAIRF